MSSSEYSSEPPPPRRKRIRPPWVDLPEHITASILQKMGAIEMLQTAQRVCRAWRKICKDPSTWRVIHMVNPDDPSYGEVCRKMFRHAVDLSQGQMVDITIEYFADDELLAYIAERSGQLRRLQLVCCWDVEGEGLSQAAKKLPLLEELHLYHVNYVDTEALTLIGRSCPLLKSFTLNQQYYSYDYDEALLAKRDEKALAVASSMPKLRDLQLFGNSMTNKGLTAILDKCPLLESLDLRKCFSLNLDSDLGARCLQQIKDLKLPNDSGYPCNCREYRDPDDFDRASLRRGYVDIHSDFELSSEEYSDFELTDEEDGSSEEESSPFYGGFPYYDRFCRDSDSDY